MGGFDTATSIRKCLASYDTREIQSVTWFGRCSNTQLANFNLETTDLNNRLRGINTVFAGFILWRLVLGSIARPLNKALTTHLHRVSLDLTRYNIFTNSIEKMTCLQLCALFNFQISGTFLPVFMNIFLGSWSTLCKCVVTAFIQRSWRIPHWTILKHRNLPINDSSRKMEIGFLRTCRSFHL